jgi:ketopantoate hydroxymethyltransferase
MITPWQKLWIQPVLMLFLWVTLLLMAGHETTLPITLIYHASSVVRAIERALVVVDLPFEVTSLILKKPCVRQSNHERKWHAKSWKVEKKRIH